MTNAKYLVVAMRDVRCRETHRQVVLKNLQSGKVLRILCDLIRDPEMNDREFEAYCEGAFHAFNTPTDPTIILDENGNHFSSRVEIEV